MLVSIAIIAQASESAVIKSAGIAKKRNLIVYYVLCFILNYPFILYWNAAISRDVALLTGSRKPIQKVAIYVSIIGFIFEIIAIAYFISEMENPNMNLFYDNLMWYFGAVGALSSIAALVFSLASSDYWLDASASQKSMTKSILKMIGLFFLYLAAFPYVQNKLNKSISQKEATVV